MTVVYNPTFSNAYRAALGLANTAGRRAFEAYAQASGSGLEWGILNAEEQARWVAVERALVPAMPTHHQRSDFPRAHGTFESFAEAILNLSYDHLPAGHSARVSSGSWLGMQPGQVEILIRHA